MSLVLKRENRILEEYIELVLEEAKLALSFGDVPVGAIIFDDNGIVSLAHNQKEEYNNALGHAEIIALNKALASKQTKYLGDCTILVTLEPCLMCLGGLINARIKKIIYLASDEKTGALGGFVDILALPKLNHYPQVEYLESPIYHKMLKTFFTSKRKNKKNSTI
jgi:tRNA(adenine34) deaminase